MRATIIARDLERNLGDLSRLFISAIHLGDSSRRFISAIHLGDSSRRFIPAIHLGEYLAGGTTALWCPRRRRHALTQ